MDGALTCMGDVRNVYNIWIKKYDGKRPLGRPRRRWKDTTTIMLGK